MLTLPMAGPALIANAPIQVGNRFTNLSDKNNSCAISINNEPVSKLNSLTIYAQPGLPTVDVVVRGLPNDSFLNHSYTIKALLYNGSIIELKARDYYSNKIGQLHFSVENSLLGFIAKRSIISVEDGSGNVILSFNNEGSEDALSWLGKCEVAVIKSWGADPRRLRPLVLPGQQGFVDVSSHVRYPEEAKIVGAQGRSIALLFLDPHGIPKGCSVVVSSGNEYLDKMTCEIGMRYEHYPPYSGIDGHQKDSWIAFPIRWRLVPPSQ